MEVDHRRNCYSCGGFRHLGKYYRNQRIVGQGRRIEYGDNCINMDNLKEKENLVVLN